MAVKVKFWGVRGSIACPSPNHIGYGGNTSCVEIAYDDVNVILDAGTGLRALGQDYIRRHIGSGVLLVTHTHWDHINGFPFFAPLYLPGWKFRVLAGHLTAVGGIRSVLANQMNDPTFPVPLSALKAEMTYEDFRAGDTLADLLPGLSVRTAALRHPNGATGYRLELRGKAIAYVTDTEHVPGEPDQTVLDLIDGADLVIYDSTYTDAEFPAKIGWGHSTWQEGIRLCRRAGVRKLAIFHHDPDHADADMAEIERQARQMWGGAIVSRDEMTLLVE
ncbi:MBL fold metallo-hydrolase [Telmatospirillum sp.]|uniref:MBL fold metallo-hydrolase n=1 Tax=Telmatospirillum sp. TaxID=2079197 RepID=UPI002844EC1A|nr:MBL fold metallo-hydrolase [Telmatospirillum sp.]MDR3439313.1 MBL fold metallo-hydrolase [Telmatospirillum sp.]